MPSLLNPLKEFLRDAASDLLFDGDQVYWKTQRHPHHVVGRNINQDGGCLGSQLMRATDPGSHIIERVEIWTEADGPGETQLLASRTLYKLDRTVRSDGETHWQIRVLSVDFYEKIPGAVSKLHVLRPGPVITSCSPSGDVIVTVTLSNPRSGLGPSASGANSPSPSTSRKTCPVRVTGTTGNVEVVEVTDGSVVEVVVVERVGGVGNVGGSATTDNSRSSNSKVTLS